MGRRPCLQAQLRRSILEKGVPCHILSLESAESYRGSARNEKRERSLAGRKRQEGSDVKPFSAAYGEGVRTSWMIGGNHEGTIKTEFRENGFSVNGSLIPGKVQGGGSPIF